MKRHMIIVILLLIPILLILNLLFSIQVAHASNLQENYDDVIKNAPEGLDITKYFEVGHFSIEPEINPKFYPFQTNSANIYNNLQNPQDIHNGRVLNLARGNETLLSSANSDESDPIQISQTGAAWSKNDGENDNYLDISRKQTVSVWLYFGSGDDTKPVDNGEGMSLVLQNDPRGVSAMGAGYQGLGSMGFDGGDNKEVTNRDYIFNLGGFIKYSSNNGVKVNTPKVTASTAVQNSIALNFNSQINSLISSGENALQPILTARTPEIKTDYNHKNRQALYTLNSFGTTNSSILPSKDFPEYDQLKGDQFLLRLGNSNNPYGVISLTYPGLPLTYKTFPLYGLAGTNPKGPAQDGSATNLWSKLNADNSDSTGMSTFQVKAKNARLVDGVTADGKPIYWHHVTFTWNPATATKPAMIKYSFNDKFMDGSPNYGQANFYPEVDDEIPVDPSVFKNPDKNRVYWGLTGANSASTNNYSKMAIFESIPALVTADVKTTMRDIDAGHDLNVGSSNLVSNGHRVSIDYNLSWDDSSRKNWTNIVSTMKLPSNIDYSSAEITYHNQNGDSQAVPINVSGTNLTYTLKSLGNILDGNGYTSADIKVIGKTNNQTNAVLTEDTQPARFAGDNAIETTGTPKFKIDGNDDRPKKLELTVSKELDFQDINYQTNAKYLSRKSSFILRVTALKEPWLLKVSSTGLKNGQQPFYGELVYKKSSGSTPLFLNDTVQEIASGEASDTTSVTDISKQWKADSGILLKPDNKKITPAGKYTGKLIWEVDDPEV